MNKNSRCQFWVTVFLLLILISHSAYAESQALKDLTIHIASVQEILSDPKMAGAQRRLERRDRAVTVLHRVFDFGEMSRRSLGANARRYSGRLEEFTPLFVSLLEQTYMSQLEENGNARIEYVKELVAPIGGLKVATENGWFAARPSGTENIYKIYVESFKDQQHLGGIVDEAQRIVKDALESVDSSCPGGRRVDER